MIQFETVTVYDDMAAELASHAGVSWERLHNYPGYERNYWRDKARAVMAGMKDGTFRPRRFVGSTDAWVCSA